MTDPVPETPKATFDLDAARAARRAKLGHNPTVLLDGQTWTLVAEVPMEVLEHIEVGRVSAVRRLLVSDVGPDPDTFPLSTLTVEDLKDLLRKVYGLGPTT
ncbi:MAG TPA: hypothetical protein VGA36_03165 [Nitriliruptorales bacterium]